MEKYTYIRKTITWDSRRYEVRGKTEQEACEKLADLVVSLKRGEFAASGQTTVEQWFQQWMQTYKIPSGITPKSLRLYDEKYNGYIGPAIGQKKLQDVRDLHLQTILNTQAGRSYSHVSKLRMVLQELFRQARRSRLIVFDPAEGLQLPESTKRSHRPITAAEAVLPYVKDVDLILVMTVEPGFGGQKFMTDMMPKVQAIRGYIDAMNPACELEVDGGVDANTCHQCIHAGANVLVAGSAVYKAADIPQRIKELRG